MGMHGSFARGGGRNRRGVTATGEPAFRSVAAVAPDVGSPAGYVARLFGPDSRAREMAYGRSPHEALRALRDKVASRGRGMYAEEQRRVDLRAVQVAKEALVR